MNKRILRILTGCLFASLAILPLLWPVTPAYAQSSYFQAVTNLHPTAYWPMHEMTAPAPGDIETNYGTLGPVGNGYYADWNINNGSPGDQVIQHQITGALVNDPDGAAMFNFNGNTNSYLLVPHTSPGTTLRPPFTVECWVWSSDATFGDIFSQDGTKLNGGNANNQEGFRISWNRGNNIQTYGTAGGLTGGSTPLNQWHYVAVTYDGTNQVMYVNGTEAARTTHTGYVVDYWDPMTIGNGLWNSGGPTRAATHLAIDEVAVYDTIVDATTLGDHYNLGINGSAGQYFEAVTNSQPVLYYRMDAPAYSAPASDTWPVLTNYGSVAVNGVYTPGTSPGGVAGPTDSTGLPIAGFGSTNAMPGNGMSAFADAGYDPAFDPTGNTPLTIAAWFKGNPVDGRFQNILGHSDSSWRIALDGRNGTVHFNAGAGAEITSAQIYNDGNWHQVVGVYDGATNYLYVDGALDTLKPDATNSIAGSPANVLLGADPQYVDRNSGVGRQFAGNLCEVAFWNGTALDADQVLALYSAAQLPPVVTAQPATDRTVNGGAGTYVYFGVVINGSVPLSYQWYFNTSSNYSGATLLVDDPVKYLDANTFQVTVTNLTQTDSGYYYVVVTNNYGSVTSQLASLTVRMAPTINAQFPVTYTNNYTLFAGTSPQFTIASVSGAAPIMYQWYANGVADPSGTNASYQRVNVPVGSLSTYCVVSNEVTTVTSFVWTATVVAAPTAPYPQSVLGLSPVGYWRLNEPDNGLVDGNPGTIAHDYAGGNDAIYTNVYLGQPGYSSATDPTTTSAGFGILALSDSLAGEIAGIDFAGPVGTSSAFSIAAWVNGSGYSEAGGAGLVTKGYGNGGEQFDLDVYNNGFRFFVRDASGATHGYTSPVALDANWHYVVGVCDEPAGSISLYIDGLLAGQGSIASGSGILASAEPVTIGARRSGAAVANYDLQFQGSMNDVAIYNYALSAAQVGATYSAAGVPPKISQQPPLTASVSEGGVLTIEAEVIGTEPLSYQWADALSSPEMADQTNATLVLSNVPATMTGDSFWLTVNNLYGSADTAATPTTLTVISGAPQILASNLPPQVFLPLGKSYTYSVSVFGTEPFTYQWSQGGSPVPGATGSSYTVPGDTLGSSTISVTVNNSQGSAGGSSVLTVVPVASDPYANAVLGLQPAGYWPLQETSAPAPATMETNYGSLGTLGTAYYAGTNAAAAVTGGNVTFGVAGALVGSGDDDPAVGFLNDNNNSHLFVPINSPALRLKAPLTFECWYNPNSGSPFGDIMGNGGAPGDGSGNWGGIRISYSGSGGGRLEAYCYHGSGSGYNALNSGDGLTAGAWHQCVLTYDGTTVVLFVDGAQKNSANLSVADSDDVPLTVGTGRWDSGPTRTPSGAVDEVAVYTNALSPDRVMAHYVAGTTPTGSNYVSAVEADQPLVYYRMDGIYTNPSPAAYPAALNFGSSPVQGNYQSGVTPGGVAGPSILGLSSSLAAPINGVFSCVDAGYDPAFDPTGTQPFTAMTWFKGNPADNRVQCIMGQGQNWAMNLDGGNGHLVWNLYSGGQVTSTTVLNDGNWHLIAGVYDGVNSYLYVDGALDNSGLATGGLTGEPNTDLYLGGNADYTFDQYYWGARYFAGALAQAAYFTNALTATQIQDLYNLAGLPSLSLHRVGSDLVITYTGTLLSSPTVDGTYDPVSGASSPYTVPQTDSQRFYRASNP